jgi:S-DNA-T family DNA segregation ATPase FtsK/SpoIIIE
MAMIERSLDGMAALTSELGAMARRRVTELCGIAVISLAMMVALALASWSVADPSLSHATDAPVRNWMGWPGAVAADLMMQLLGLGALALILPVAIWGYRLLGHRAMGRERLRVMLWPVGAVLAAALASCLPRGAHWPLPCGLGGVIGDAILRLPVLLFHVPIRGGNSVIAGVVLGAAAAIAIAAASGLLWRDADADDDEADEEPAEQNEDDRDRGWISLGWLTHSLLSLRARLAHLFGLRKRRPMPSADAVLRGRIEPRFGAAADADSDEEADDEEDEPAPVRKPRPRARRSSGGYVLPALEFLNPPSRVGRATVSSEILQENAVALEGVLADFGVRGEIINARPGPVVTLYELEPAPGIKSSRVISLADDIARSMSALSARVAVVSGRNAIGIELPNPTRERVYLRELLSSRDYAETAARLPLCLGKAIGGEAVLVDLQRMPHLLIAGTTGSGKSVAINTMILSLVYRLRPDGRSENARTLRL